VIIKYLSSIPLLQGGTVTTSNGYQIHTFTATGSHTVAVEAACGAWRYYRYYVPVASANPHHLCINEMQYLYGGSVLSTPATHCGSAPCAFATSGFYSDWSPEKAFDQSNYAMYGSGYCNEAGDGYPRGAGWLAYDFGVPTQVDQVKIWFWRGDHSASGTAYMEGSNDAVTWTTLKTITDTDYATLDTTVDCVASPSSAPTLLMKLRAGSNTFQYDASYWTDTSVLNEAGGASVSDSDDEDVKMSAFNTVSISALTLCYKTLDNCYTYELGATYTSASALFSSGFIRSENLGYGAGAADAAKQAWTDLFLPPGTPTWYDDYWNGNGGGNCNMQRPGINTQCNDNNWARIGYCVNLPDQSCQPYDTSDADSPIGIGLKTQNWPNNVNAPFGEYFIHGAGSSGVQLFQHQAWLFAGSATTAASPTPSPTPFPTAFPTPFPTAFPTPFPTGFPTPFPTPSPTPSPTYPPGWPTPHPTFPPGAAMAGGAGGAAATGDPHLQNVHGERFDLMQPGKHVLINIPRGVRPDEALLRVQADARRMGSSCADMYFVGVNVTGSFAEARRAGGYRYAVSTRAVETPEWVAFGKVELKVVQGHTQSGISYLNVYVKHLGRAGFAVGGLLGEDDHNDVMIPPPGCTHHVGLVDADLGVSGKGPSVSSVAVAYF